MKECEIIGAGNIKVKNLVDFRNDAHRLDPLQKQQMETTWDLAVSESKGRLFNGTLLSYISSNIQPDQILVNGHFTSYKYFWAQRNIPEFSLGISPIGVSGMILSADANDTYAVFAKRTDFNLQYPGYYELIPSGGINEPTMQQKEVNFYDQLAVEFTEETGMDINAIKTISCLGLLYDTRDNVYDIACLITTQLNKEKLGHEIKLSNEYTNPEFVAVDQLHGFIERNKDHIVPTSIGLIELFNQMEKSNI